MKTKEIIKQYFQNKTCIKGTTIIKFFKLYPNIYRIIQYILKRNKNWESCSNILLAIINNEYLTYCEYCHKQLKFSKRNQIYCSTKCLNLDPDIQNKIQLTKLNKYGSKTFNNSQKTKETCLQKYGVNNPAKLNIIKNKIQTTCIQRYGVKFSAQSEIMKNKSELTKLKRYGNKHFINKEKSKNTILEKTYNQFLNSSYIIPLFTLKEYEGVIYYNKKYKWKCKQCGAEFEDTCYSKIPRCLNCFPILNGTSLLEKELINFCKQYVKINSHNKTLIKPYELDIVIPSLKLAIEFNGNYWHSLNAKPLGYHLMKTELCENIGYRLIHIWEDNWLNNSDKIKNHLLSIFNNNEQINLSKKLSREWYSISNFPKNNIIIYKPTIEYHNKFACENCGYFKIK